MLLTRKLNKKLVAAVLLFSVLFSVVPHGLPGGPLRAEAWEQITPITVAATVIDWWKGDNSGTQAKAAMRNIISNFNPLEAAWDALGGLLGSIAQLLLVFIAKGLFTFAGFLMGSMATMFDYALAVTLSSEILDRIEVIDVGWTLSRDVANMFFIFILLYIAIQTILGIAGHNTKTLLRNVILVALLINFSLFLTKVIIDGANILALHFFWKVETVIAPPGQPEEILYGPSHAIMAGLKLQTMFYNGNIVNAAAIDSLEDPQPLMIYLGGAILMFIAAYVFLVGLFMMIYRTIVLIFCMIFAPLAFLGYILPKASQISSTWWNHLISNALVAPVFTFMIYFVVVMIKNNDLIGMSGAIDKSTFNRALLGDPQHYKIIFNYIILIGMLVGVLYVSKAVSGGAASFATKWANRSTGGAVAGGAGTIAFGWRNTVGRIAKNKLDDPELQAAVERGDRNAIIKRARYERLAKTTGDLRNIPGVGKALSWGAGQVGIDIGKGTQKSAYQAVEKEEKKRQEAIATAQRLFPNNAEAQSTYINEKLGPVSERQKYVTGYTTTIDPVTGRPVVTAQHGTRTVHGVPAIESRPMRETRRKLDREARQQATERELNALVEGINNPALIPPALRGPVWDAHVHATVQRAQPQDIAELPERMFGNFTVTPPEPHGQLLQHLSNAQLAALGNRTETSDRVISLIRAYLDDAGSSATPQQRTWLANVRAHNPASRWM